MDRLLSDRQRSACLSDFPAMLQPLTARVVMHRGQSENDSEREQLRPVPRQRGRQVVCLPWQVWQKQLAPVC